MNKVNCKPNKEIIVMPTVKPNKMTLTEILGKLKKDELTELRQALDVRGVSQLNKADLAKRLTAEIVDKMEDSLERMDIERFTVLLSVMKAPDGIVSIKKIDDNYDSMYFQQYGLLFAMDDYVFMPQEVVAKLKTLDMDKQMDLLRRNERWANLTRGLLFYYGYMDKETLTGHVERLTGEPVDGTAFWRVVCDLAFYDYSLNYDEDNVWNFMLKDPSELIAEQQNRPNLPYYPFAEPEVIRAAAHDYVDRHEGYKKFASVLRKHWRVDAKSLDIMADEAASAIQNGASMNDLLIQLMEHLELGSDKEMNELMDALASFHNHTRMWVLKGHSPEEMSAYRQGAGPVLQPQGANAAAVAPLADRPAPLDMPKADVYSFQTKQKIGRNEPCPCGSGKKYKKCCGAGA
jgi:hypothetical protein